MLTPMQAIAALYEQTRVEYQAAKHHTKYCGTVVDLRLIKRGNTISIHSMEIATKKGNVTATGEQVTQ